MKYAQIMDSFAFIDILITTTPVRFDFKPIIFRCHYSNTSQRITFGAQGQVKEQAGECILELEDRVPVYIDIPQEDIFVYRGRYQCSTVGGENKVIDRRP